LDLKPNDSVNNKKYSFENKPKLRKYFLDYLFQLLLLPYSTHQQQQQQQSTPLETPLVTTTNEIPACMSESSFKRFKLDLNIENSNEADTEQLEIIKIGILKFLSINLYNPEEILFHFIISTSDTRYSVVQMAELHIKRIVGSVDLNDTQIVNQLFHIFLGDNKMLKNIKNENRIEPSNTRIRLKLFPYIIRSRGAASTIPQAIQIVFDSLFGSPSLTNQKIKHYSIQFVHLIALHCDTDALTKVGAVLLQGVNKLIADKKADSKLRGLAYVAVGKLSRRIPSTVSSDISIVHNFFSALESEQDTDTRMHIQEALVLMMDAFRQSKKEEKNLLLTLLFQYIENDVAQCRSMAVKYAFEIFDYDNLESRYLLLLATSDVKEEIRQESILYLRRTQDSDGNELQMASFVDWVDFIGKKSEDRLKRNYKVFTQGTHTLPFDLNCYQQVLVILRLALSKSAQLKPQIIDAKNLDAIKDEAPLLVNYVAQLGKDNLNSLFKYINIIKEYTLTVGNPLGVYLLLEICSISSLNIGTFLKDDLEWLKSQAFSVNDQVRVYAAELWSLVFINNLIEKYETLHEELSKEFFQTLLKMQKNILSNVDRSFNERFETKHGCILLIGFAIGKYYHFMKENGDLSLNIGQNKQILNEIISVIVNLSDNPNLSMVSIISIGEMSRNGPLVFNNSAELTTIIDKLVSKLRTSKETNKLKEKAAATVGYMCINDHLIINKDNQLQYHYNVEDSNETFDSFNKYVMQKLLDSSQAKQIELHMAIGEALVNCALGNKSNAGQSIWLSKNQNTDSIEIETSDVDDSNIEWLLNRLIQIYLPNSNQHLRQAACFWTLIFVKKCAKMLRVVQKYLFKIQDAFIIRLGEADEVTQEVASKAIGLIFSLADKTQKDTLVEKLVDTLSGNNKQKHKKQQQQQAISTSGLKINDENEEIFEEGQLGKTPDGANIGTYKELCSLASDLNRPDLVYQFMNLAHHNSIWNTRRGAAFGFNAISQLSQEQLQPFLALIVPKLFRYQFDPNVKISQSMTAIWNSLIKQDNKKIIDNYLLEILNDIELNMISPVWRVRESCCNALLDLLKGGRNLEPISGQLGTFWSLLFKLVDDIKESVRTSAQHAIKSLQRVTITYSSSVSNITICEKTINSVLPQLIKQGLQSNMQEVRSISVFTIRDMAKLASARLIKPYLIEMIINLLESLSGYEPADLNYISLKLGSADAQEKLDQARISASKDTPMIEIININMVHLNEVDLLTELIPRLIEIIRRGLGVSTKAGVCHILCRLVDEQPLLMGPFSGKLMASLVNAMSNEKNKTINKCYCNAIGCIIKIAKESSIENLLNKLQDWYFEREDEGIKLSCGLTLLAIAHNNSEVIQKFSKKCIPFVFFAMHQQQQNDISIRSQQLPPQIQVWHDIWEDITSGTEYAIRGNLSEIVSFTKLGLEHQSWPLRIQAAMSICTIAVKLQSNIDDQYLNELLMLLNSSLNTRTWSGKDRILIAISSIFINCKLKLSFDNDLIESLIKNMFKEASKQSSNVDINYRVASLRCLSDLIQFSSSHFKDAFFQQYWSLFMKKYFENDLEELMIKERQRREQLEEQLKKKMNIIDEDVELINIDDENVKDNNEQSNKKSKKNDDDKDDDDDDDEEGQILDKLKLLSLETIGKCWPYTPEIQSKNTHFN
jgi:proteasome component ECM29